MEKPPGARQRAGPVIPGLARLLADAPREKRLALARRWGLGDAVGSGQLYRRMTENAAVQAAVAGLDRRARLVFDRLGTAAAPRDRDRLLQSLPLSEDALDTALASLEALGLAWRLRAPGEAARAAGPGWLVPRDVIGALSPVRRQTSAPGSATHETTENRRPDLPPLDRRPETVLASGDLLTLLSEADRQSSPGIEVPGGSGPNPLAPFPPREGGTGRWASVSGSPFPGREGGEGVRSGPPPREGAILPDRERLALRREARRLGVALGIWQVAGRRPEPGPRFAAWQALNPVGRIRALARWWLVDEAGAVGDAGLRHACWAALRAADANSWYDFNGVARRIAWEAHAGRSGGPAAPASGRAIARADVEQALSSLARLGVLELGADRTGRLVAVRLTPDGRAAIAD